MEDNPDIFDNDDQKSSTPILDNSVMSPIDDSEPSTWSFLWIILGVSAMCLGVVVAGAFFYFKPDVQALVGQYFPSLTLTPSRAPTSTPTPTITPTATLTPTPNLTATQQALDVTSTMAAIAVNATQASSKWNLIYSDKFDANKNNWLSGPSDDSYAKVDYSIADGKYTWAANSHQDFIGWVRISTKIYSNVYLTVQIAQHTDSDSANMDSGLIFREDPNGNFYYFAITGDQNYFLARYYDKEWTDLVPANTSSAISAAGPNRLTVIAEDDHFSLFINDQFVADTSDDKITKGTNALAIELTPTDVHAVYDFDNLEVRVK